MVGRVTILYEDDDLPVIDKAAGLLTVPSPIETEETVVAGREFGWWRSGPWWARSPGEVKSPTDG